MAQNSKIEWTDHTANLWWGCSKVHEGCDNCYADVLSHRLGNDIWGTDKPRKEIKGVWKELAKMQKLAKAAGEKHRVFVGSMMDIFEKPMPIIDAAIPEYTTGVLRQRLFGQINDGWFPNLVFLFLTKRPSNINKMIPSTWQTKMPENVMFGTSISTQKNANTLIPQLMLAPGRKFLSIEPQIEHIDLWKNMPVSNEGKYIDWVIQGGESGSNKRPFDIKWARSMREQCQLAGIPYFFKQIDKIQQIPDDLLIRQFPKM